MTLVAYVSARPVYCIALVPPESWQRMIAMDGKWGLKWSKMQTSARMTVVPFPVCCLSQSMIPLCVSYYAVAKTEPED